MNFQRKRVESRDQLTLKGICLNGMLITALFFLNSLGFLGSLVCYVSLIVIAIYSLEGAVKAISLSAIVVIANPYLININEVHAILRFPLIAVAGARIYWDASHKCSVLFARAHLRALLIFGIISLCLAFLNQYFFMISFFKLVVFIYGAYAIMLASDVSCLFESKLTNWFCALVLFYIIGNLIAYALGVGYTFQRELYEVGEKPTLGYAGMTGHPQAQGVISAISFVYAFSVYLFTSYRLRWLMGLASLALLILCYTSASRTGFFAALISIAVSVVTAFFMRRESMRKVRMNISPIQVVTIVFISVLCLITVELITSGAILQKLSDFSVKAIRNGSGFSFERIYSSRIHLIEVSWHNFMQKPLTGIGFGTMWNARWAAEASILAAPTEKGFLPTALLEEVGILGGFFFVLFLIAFFYHYWKLRNIIALSMMTCLLLLNFGEMMFFSLGGVGLYGWSMIGAGIATGNRVLKKRSLAPPVFR